MYSQGLDSNCRNRREKFSQESPNENWLERLKDRDIVYLFSRKPSCSHFFPLFHLTYRLETKINPGLWIQRKTNTVFNVPKFFLVSLDTAQLTLKELVIFHQPEIWSIVVGNDLLNLLNSFSYIIFYYCNWLLPWWKFRENFQVEGWKFSN